MTRPKTALDRLCSQMLRTRAGADRFEIVLGWTDNEARSTSPAHPLRQGAIHPARVCPPSAYVNGHLRAVPWSCRSSKRSFSSVVCILWKLSLGTAWHRPLSISSRSSLPYRATQASPRKEETTLCPDHAQCPNCGQR